MCDIQRAVKICKLVRLTSYGVYNFQAIKGSEGNKRRSGKFFVTAGPFSASYKTPLARKALSCLYFRKTKSEEHIVSDLLGYTGPTAKRRMRPCSPHFEQSFYRWLFNSGGPLQWRGLNKDLVVVLLSLHTNRNKLKGSEDFK